MNPRTELSHFFHNFTGSTPKFQVPTNSSVTKKLHTYGNNRIKHTKLNKKTNQIVTATFENQIAKENTDKKDEKNVSTENFHVGTSRSNACYINAKT